MPLLVFLADGVHVEPLVGKGLIDLVAHLETLQMDARTYLCHDVLSM